MSVWMDLNNFEKLKILYIFVYTPRFFFSKFGYGKKEVTYALVNNNNKKLVDID